MRSGCGDSIRWNGNIGSWFINRFKVGAKDCESGELCRKDDCVEDEGSQEGRRRGVRCVLHTGPVLVLVGVDCVQRRTHIVVDGRNDELVCPCVPLWRLGF